MKKNELKDIILEQLIYFLKDHDLFSSDDQIIYNNQIINPPEPIKLWEYVVDTFAFDETLQHLFKSLKDALISEEYQNAHQLKLELSRNLIITEENILDIGSEQLVKFGLGISNSKLLSYHSSDVHQILFYWKIFGMAKSDSIYKNLAEIKTSIYNYSPDIIADEAVDVIIQMQHTHPVLFVDKILMFFQLLQSTED